jgi:hypothetical protein
MVTVKLGNGTVTVTVGRGSPGFKIRFDCAYIRGGHMAGVVDRGGLAGRIACLRTGQVPRALLCDLFFFIVLQVCRSTSCHKQRFSWRSEFHETFRRTISEVLDYRNYEVLGCYCTCRGVACCCVAGSCMCFVYNHDGTCLIAICRSASSDR